MHVSEETLAKFRRGHCVMAGFCAMTVLGQVQLLGNLGVYVESYLIQHVGFPRENTFFIQTVTGVMLVATSLLMIPAGVVVHVFGEALTTFLGMAIVIVSRVLTYWAVDQSVLATVLLMGVLPGFGCGLFMGCPYSALNKFKFKNPGLMYGLVSAGMGGGAFVHNIVITAFVNPHNLSPNDVTQHARHFSQPEIMDRVPWVLVLQAFVYLLILPVTVAGVRNPPKTEINEMLIPSTDSKQTSPAKGTHDTTDMSPKQLLVSRDFYLWWFAVLCTTFVNFAFQALFKTMGLTSIPDDVYMVTVASVGSLVNAVARPVWGMIADRLEIKKSMVLFCGIICLLHSLSLPALRAGRVTHFLSVTVTQFVNGGALVHAPVIVRQCFGQTHFVANFGLLNTAVTATAILMPFVTSAAIYHLGWMGLTITLAAVSFTGMIATVLVKGPKTKSHTHQEEEADDDPKRQLLQDGED